MILIRVHKTKQSSDVFIIRFLFEKMYIYHLDRVLISCLDCITDNFAHPPMERLHLIDISEIVLRHYWVTTANPVVLPCLLRISVSLNIATLSNMVSGLD